MVREAIPREGILERFGRGFSQGFRSREQTIAKQQLQSEQARLANAMAIIQVVAGLEPDNKKANTILNQRFLDDRNFPEFTGGNKDFSKFLDGYRARKQQPFTLSPGEQRFTGAGAQIAKVPAKKQPFTLSPGQQRFTETGAQITKVPAVPVRQQPFTLSPGEQRFTEAGQPVAKVSAKKREFKQSDIVVNPVTKQQGTVSFDERGNITFTPIQTAVGTLTATQKQLLGTVPGEAISKPTQTKIEKDVIDLQTTLTELDSINSRFNENFFIKLNLQNPAADSKATAALTATAEKFKIPVSQARKKFLSEKTTFFADAKRVFLKFRKFITGVAGGIEEFREIAKATIDPESDSPTQFNAKMASMRDNATRTQNVLLAIRNSGLDPSNKAVQRQVFKGLSLKNVPLNVSGNVTLDTLQSQQDILTQQLKPGEILVRQKSTGDIGALPESEFDPNDFERVK